MTTGPLESALVRLRAPMRAFLSPRALPEDEDVMLEDPRDQADPVRVLLVEDEAELRTIVRRRLERTGRFELVAEAEDGVQAIELAERHQPDIVLLDLMLPVLDGRAAGPQIVRAAPRSMLVILSALQAEDEAEQALAGGAFAYVEKTELGAAFASGLLDLLARFRLGISGQTVIAPSGERASTSQT